MNHLGCIGSGNKVQKQKGVGVGLELRREKGKGTGGGKGGGKGRREVKRKAGLAPERENRPPAPHFFFYSTVCKAELASDFSLLQRKFQCLGFFPACRVAMMGST